MAPSYKTPGTYIEELSTLPLSLTYYGDAVPAFIGYTQTTAEDSGNDLLHRCKRISSLAEFEQYFGLPPAETNMRVTIVETADTLGRVLTSEVSAVLDNQDRSPYILHYAMQLFYANGGGICHIIPINGYQPLGIAVSLQDFKLGVAAAAKLDEVNLLVMPEAQSLSMEDYRQLSDIALAQCAAIPNQFLILDVPIDVNKTIVANARLFREQAVGGENLKYGAAYLPNLATRIAYAIDEASLQVSHLINGQTTTLSLLELSQKSAMLYGAAWKRIRELSCELPPSAAIAAIYQVIDRTRGAWKAPANVDLKQVSKPSILMQDSDQAALSVDAITGKSINTIRQFTGRGTLVWGARTLAGNDNEFRYVSTSRLVSGIQESTEQGISPFLFEPNTPATWNKIQAVIEHFLHQLWGDGAMQGTKPEQAYYVKVGLGKTMTAQDVLESYLVIEIGIAAIRASEFIIIKSRHRIAQS